MPGNFHKTVREMLRMNINVLMVSEVEWPRSGQTNIEGYTIYYVGNDDPNTIMEKKS